MSIVPFFYQHFHDLSGKLAAAGRMHVYRAGSEIPKAIWEDVAMSVPLDNPMTLDGNGVAPQWFVGEGLVDIKVYTNTGSLIFTALNVSGTAASGQTPWPAASTGYLYFDEGSGVYSWRDAPGDHKVMVNANDTPTYLDQKLLGNGDLQWEEVEIEPGVWGMRAVINTAGLPGIETLTLLPPSHMEFRQLSADPKNPRFLLEWTGSAADLVKTDGNSIAKNSLEPALGNPTANDLVLASTTTGQRYWRAAGGAGVGYLPLAGGTMDLNAQISWPNESEYSAGMYFGSALGNWTQINRRQVYYAESATRSGFYIIPTTNPANGGTSLVFSRAGRTDLSLYAHQDGGYASFNDQFGNTAAAIGAHPSSGGGEIQIRSETGQPSFYHYGNSGETWTSKRTLQWSGEPVCSTVSAIAYADAAITTTAERSIISADGTAPFESIYVRAGRLSSQGVGLKMEAMGVASSGANQALTLRTYRDGALVGTIAVTSQNFGTNTPWRFVLKVRPTGDGLRIIGRFYYTASNANFGVSCQAFTTLVTPFDNNAHTYDVTAQWGGAGNSMSTHDWEAWA